MKLPLEDGIGNYSFEQTGTAKEVPRVMRAFNEVFLVLRPNSDLRGRLHRRSDEAPPNLAG